ncbi:hypothetical protein ACM66B_000813 [Microbotryomycetes sp. NB124-2]
MPRREATTSRAQQTLVHAATAIKAASTDEDGALDRQPQPQRRTTRRWLRANNVLGKLLSALIATFIVKGTILVLGDTARFLDVIQSRPKLALAYRVHFVLWLVYLLTSFYNLYLAADDRKPIKPPRQVLDNQAVYECDAEGQPARCFLDDCNGAYKSIRTRHCRDCGKCRPGFDHHCPFVDACVYEKSFKPFVCFMASALPLIGVAVLPLLPLQRRAIKSVVRYTWSTAEMQRMWWGRPWLSWAGGPAWRYFGAVLLGYRLWRQLEPEPPLLLPDTTTRTFTKNGITWAYDESVCPSLTVPSFEPLMLVLAAFLIWTIGLAMIVAVVLNARRGLSTVQVERIRRWRAFKADFKGSDVQPYDPRIHLWVPVDRNDEDDDNNAVKGAVVVVDPDTPLFDFETRQNWNALMGGPNWVDWCIPWRLSKVDDLTINPQVLANLRAQARAKSMKQE